MTTWLLRRDVWLELQRFRAELKTTAAQQAEFAAKIAAPAAASPDILSFAGDTAEISIVGVLTERMSFVAWLFGLGNTTYGDIRESIAVAEQDPAIKRIVLNVSSPGGTVEGLFETLAVLEGVKKPITTRSTMATSAAYAIASQTDRIEALTPASEFGSIGVAVTYFNDESLIDITSTEAPDKRPDPSTEEGQAVIREHLDAIHDLFVDAIARGRGTDKATVNAEYGRGAVLLAGEARKRKMIDATPSRPRAARAEAATEPRASEDEQTRTEPRSDNTADGGQTERTNMNEQELKAKHPELYQALMDKGEKLGVAKERDRVTAHLIRGEANDAMELAIEAVDNGTEMTETMKAKYDARGRNRDAEGARQAETDAAAASSAGAVSSEQEKDDGDLIADSMDRLYGPVSDSRGSQPLNGGA